MRSINSGNNYHIYDNTVSMYDALPNRVYQIEFDQMQGFSLSGKDPITVSEKVYGVQSAKVQKVLDTFGKFERSLGVILSGDKGTGKSLFSKLLCEKAVDNGLPVLVCSQYVPGLAEFIDSMDQEMVVLFDEFDKVFQDKDGNKQTSMLSLFDGVSMHKKLFCITCNDLHRLNEFLVNRPGRFHYHFRFEYPTPNEIEEYMQDHTPADKWHEIEKIKSFAQKVKLNFDCLRAIAFELQRSNTFEEAIEDLNITKQNTPVYNIYLLFDDGSKIKDKICLDMFDPDDVTIEMGNLSEAEDDYMSITFSPDNLTFNGNMNGFYLAKDKLKADAPRAKDADSWVMRNHPDYVKTHMPDNIIGLLIKSDFSQNSALRYFHV